jgi:hypothetical protein
MTTEERIKLVLELIGKEEIKSAAAEARNLAKELKEVGIVADKAASEIYEFADVYELAPLEQDTKKLTAAMQNLTQGVAKAAEAKQRLSGVMGGQLVGAFNQTQSAAGRSGMAVLELSRGVEDLQYGVRGVLNNLPVLIMAMGGGAGLAGVASLAAVALSQLWERSGDLFKLWGEGDTETQTESMRKLTEEYKRSKEGVKELAEEEEKRREKTREAVTGQDAAGQKETARIKEIAAALGGQAVEDIQDVILANWNTRRGLNQETDRRAQQNAAQLLDQLQGNQGNEARAGAELNFRSNIASSNVFGRTAFGQMLGGETPKEAATRQQAEVKAAQEASANRQMIEAEKAKEANKLNADIRKEAAERQRAQEKAAKDAEAGEAEKDQRGQAFRDESIREDQQAILRDRKRAAGMLGDNPILGQDVAKSIMGQGRDATVKELTAQLEGQGVQNAADIALEMVMQIMTQLREMQQQDRIRWIEWSRRFQAFGGDMNAMQMQTQQNMGW